MVAEDKMMQATWRVTVTDTGSVKGHDDRKQRQCNNPNLSPHVSFSGHCMHVYIHGSVHATGYQTPRSPSYSSQPLTISKPSFSRLEIKATFFRFQCMSSFGSSSPNESESDTGSSWGDSNGPEQYHSGSPDMSSS